MDRNHPLLRSVPFATPALSLPHRRSTGCGKQNLHCHRPPTGSREARKRFLFLFILFFLGGGGRRRQRGSWRKIPPPHSVQNRGKSLAPLTRSDNSTVNFQWISRIPCSEYNTPLSPVRVFYCLYAPNKNTLNCIFPWVRVSSLCVPSLFSLLCTIHQISI